MEAVTALLFVQASLTAQILQHFPSFPSLYYRFITVISSSSTLIIIRTRNNLSNNSTYWLRWSAGKDLKTSVVTETSPRLSPGFRCETLQQEYEYLWTSGTNWAHELRKYKAGEQDKMMLKSYIFSLKKESDFGRWSKCSHVSVCTWDRAGEQPGKNPLGGREGFVPLFLTVEKYG